MPILLDDLMGEKVLCSFEFEVCELDIYEEVDVNEEIYKLLAEKPVEAFSNDYVNKMYETEDFAAPGRNQLKIVAISDLHIDYDYQEGSNNDCGKPLCCRSDSGIPLSSSTKAGKWGDYKCDLNSLALDNMLSYIKNVIKPDVVIWGGDSVPHNTDSLNMADNIEIIKNITK